MKIVFILVCLLFNLFAFSQGQIVNITVDPANPTTADEVKVYVDLMFSSGGCELDYQYQNTFGFSTNATAHHCLGMLTVICNKTDTFNLGYLPAGLHDFNFILTSGGGGPGCTPGFTADDSDSISFTVSSTNSIIENEKTNFQFYPNPSSEIITIEVNESLVSEKANIKITDVTGKVILASKIMTATFQLDLSSFTKGIYFLQLEKEGVMDVKRVVVE